MIPYKHNLLALAFLFVLSQTAFSQVKKQYKDETFAQTTVVVKENKTEASDLEILDAQFDIDDFGMDQVIKITTEPDQKKVVAVATAQPEKAPEVVEAPEAQAVPASVQNKAKIVKSAEAPVKAKEEKPVAQVRQGNTRTRSSVSSGSRTRSYSKSKKSYRNKRFKKKKRKRIRGKRYKCYKF